MGTWFFSTLIGSTNYVYIACAISEYMPKVLQTRIVQIEPFVVPNIIWEMIIISFKYPTVNFLVVLYEKWKICAG